jgi:quercetin dioxygenase-like cupin family protein
VERADGANMKITRLYTGSDQKSYFEEVELQFGGEQKILTTDPRPAKMVVFRSVAPGTVLERHTAPRRQFLVTLSGSWQIEASNGAIKTFKTGDVMLADDTTGEGHVSRVIGSEPHVFMTVPLAD